MSNYRQEYKIRFAEERDIPFLLRLLVQVNNVHQAIRPELFLRDKTKYEAGDLQEMLGKQDAPIFVAEDEAGRAVGYLFAKVKERVGPNLPPSRSFYIDDLCVDAAARGGGVGSALLEFAKDYAKSIGCGELTLNVWEGNDDALRFYLRGGFRARSTTLEYFL